MRMVRAARRLAVADGYPPALRPRVGAGEAHAGDELVADLTPSLIRQRGLVGVQAQRAVPHVSIAGSDQAALVITLGDRYPGSELLTGLIEKPRQRRRVALAQHTLSSDPQCLRGAGDQMRLFMLLALARPDEVEQHPSRISRRG